MKVSLDQLEPGNYPEDFIAKLQEDPNSIRHFGIDLEIEKENFIFIICDIRGFTSSFEKNTENHLALARFISRFSGKATYLIQEFHKGFVNKFLGDGFLAYLKGGKDTDCERAFQVAIDLANAFRAEKDFRLWKKIPEVGDFAISIMLIRGEGFLGSMGDYTYADFTVIGTDLNRGFGCLKALPRQNNSIGFEENLKESALRFFPREPEVLNCPVKGTGKQTKVNYYKI